jgi:hypothetical protein
VDRLVAVRPRPLGEQRDGLGIAKRKHRVVDFAPDAQQLATRHEQSQVRTPFDERGELRRGIDHLLEVVEEQQELPLADVLQEPVLRPERLRDLVRDQYRVAERRQADPEDARLELRNERGGGLDREPSLARAARSGQRQQPGAVLKQRRDLRDLRLPADERAGRPREIRVRDRLERREVAVPELVQRDGLVEVLQPVLAELAELAARCVRRRRCGDDHLPAVARGADPGRAVDVDSYVALAGDMRIAGVNSDADADRAARKPCARGSRRCERAGCGREGDEERVALRVDLDSAVRPERLADDASVLGKRLGVAFRAQLVEQLGRPFHVREEERDSARGKVGSHSRHDA